MSCVPPSNVIARNLLATGQNLPETQVRLYWDALNGVSGFNVYRNYTPYGDFTKLNVSLIQSTSFLDSNVPIIIDTDPYYSVTSVNLLGESPPSNPITYENLPAFDVSPFGDMNMTFTAPQTKISTVTIESRSGMYPTNIQQKFFFEEIRRRNMWLLEQDGGDFWLFKRQQKEINANTEEDYGRADTVTYFNPIKIRVRYYNMAALKELATYGLRKQRVPRSWTIWTPRLHDRDILIDRENRRFEILNVTPYFQRDLITHQDFEMNELERTDLAYKHPQLIAPDLLAPYLQGGAC